MCKRDNSFFDPKKKREKRKKEKTNSAFSLAEIKPIFKLGVAFI